MGYEVQTQDAGHVIPPSTGFTSLLCLKPVPHPVLSIRTQRGPESLGCQLWPCPPLCHHPKARDKRPVPASGVPSPHTQAHSLGPGPQQELVLRMLPVEELQEEHVSRDALGLQAQVLHLQLGYPGVDEDGKLPQPAGPKVRSAWPVPMRPASPSGPGEKGLFASPTPSPKKLGCSELELGAIASSHLGEGEKTMLSASL